MRVFLDAIRRDIRGHMRRPAEILNPLVFFIIVISLFPLGIGPSKSTLALIAPGIIWVAALLATLMSLDAMFREDLDDGSLEQMCVSREPLLLLVAAKITAHWLMAGLPLVLLTPLLAMMLYLDGSGLIAMSLSLLLVSPVLSLLGSIGAALTVGLGRGGLLIAIVILPLYVPVLIIGTAMVQTGVAGGDYSGHVYWLLAILMLALGLAPLATTAGIRVTLDR